jgi:hypothetical protein
MKVIGFVLDENKKFYDVNTMTQILGVSKTKIQREIKRNNFSEFLKYKNQYLYPEKTLFNLMEIVLIEKLENDGHN